MKDPAKHIRLGYVQRLETLSSAVVYDTMLPRNNNATKYILLTNQTSDGDRTKRKFKPNCTITVQVVCRSLDEKGSLDCDNIADDVIQAINPVRSVDYISAGDDFQVITTRLIGNESNHLMTGTEHLYRRLITFEHKVLER